LKDLLASFCQPVGGVTHLAVLGSPRLILHGKEAGLKGVNRFREEFAFDAAVACGSRPGCLQVPRDVFTVTVGAVHHTHLSQLIGRCSRIVVSHKIRFVSGTMQLQDVDSRGLSLTVSSPQKTELTQRMLIQWPTLKPSAIAAYFAVNL